MNFQKKSIIEIADEICNLFDTMGFTTEYPVDVDELRGKIANIIIDGTDYIKELSEVPNINVVESGPFERQPGE